MPEEVVTFLDEEGKERRFRLHDAFELESTPYYVVESVDDPEEVLVLREASDGFEAIAGDELDRIIEALEEEAD